MLKKFSFFIVALLCLVGPFVFAQKKSNFRLPTVGTEFPVNYEKYGTFSGRGTNNFKYIVTSRGGLTTAVGACIFPQSGAILQKDLAFLSWRRKHRGPFNPWDYVGSGDPQSDYYVWAQAGGVNPGVRLFYLAKALHEAGFIKEAIKAYYAVLIHFPKDVCWSEDNTFFWYVSGVALNQIEDILQSHPEIGYRLEGAVFSVKNGNDSILKNDEYNIDPGVWVKSSERKSVDLSKMSIKNQRGDGKVRLVQYENGHWQLLVENHPYIVKGAHYSPVPIGSSITDGWSSWMFADENDDGLIDDPYQSWVDANMNGIKDDNEPEVGDFELMKEMGANTIRILYADASPDYNPSEFNKKLLRELKDKFGIRVAMTHPLGAYTIGSGATWEAGTDYTDPVQLENMRRSVEAMVKDHRHEDYLLMWLLGNENLMPADYTGVNATRTNAATHSKEYLTFVNEMAEMIHRLDPEHPVAVGNLDVTGLEDFARYAPAVDIFGCNVYRGETGFGDLFKRIKRTFDRPVLITEYGCDAYDGKKNRENEEAQARYHEGNWKSLVRNLGGGVEEGNAIGGIIFEYIDEWWKTPEASLKIHDTHNDFPMPFPDGWANEEWFGIVSHGVGGDDTHRRVLRKAYLLYRDKLWKEN